MPDDDVRMRILDAAGAAFAENGFKPTTVRQICAAANANVAAVNYYFGDKERLYVEAIQHAHQFRSREAPLPDWPPGTPVEIRLRDFIHITVHRMIGVKAAPWQARLMMREVLQPTRAVKSLVEDYFRPHLERLLELLDEVVPAQTPIHQRHQLAFSIIGQCLFYRFSDSIIGMLIDEQQLAAHFSPPQIADHITRMTLTALGLDVSSLTQPDTPGKAAADIQP